MHPGFPLCRGTDTFLALYLRMGWKKGLQAALVEALGAGAHHIMVRQGHFW